MCRVYCILVTTVASDLHLQRAALVGANGSGKTTLLKAILGDLEFSGSYWRHAQLRIGYVSQHSIDDLKDVATQTAVQYFMERFRLPSELKVGCICGCAWNDCRSRGCSSLYSHHSVLAGTYSAASIAAGFAGLHEFCAERKGFL